MHPALKGDLDTDAWRTYDTWSYHHAIGRSHERDIL